RIKTGRVVFTLLSDPCLPVLDPCSAAPWPFSSDDLPARLRPGIVKPCPRRFAMPAVPLPSVAVHLRLKDNIAVAARNLQAGLEVQHDGRTLRLGSRVNLGHKLALRDIRQGEAIYKYGQIIG